MATSPEALRAAMVDLVVERGRPCSAPVERALRHIPRHHFVPGTPLEDAYDAFSAVVIVRAPDGTPRSSASAPSIVATMLDQLDVRPGHRVLEIGAGTGYNAALLAELVGPDGSVTTIDIDPVVTARAAAALDGTGVRVVTGDGFSGVPEHAPYDRIIVTAGAWDLPTAWFDQLIPGGRLVVPLRWRGQTHSVGFRREPDHLRSDSLQVCGFIPMAGPDGERQVRLDPGVTLVWDDDQAIDPDALHDVFERAAAARWSGVLVARDESFAGVWLRLACTEPGACFLTRDESNRGGRACAVAVADSLAYFTFRRLDDGTERAELGAIGHGPAGAELAERISREIHAWDRDRRTSPLLTVHPTAPLRAGTVIVKRQVRIVLSVPCQPSI